MRDPVDLTPRPAIDCAEIEQISPPVYKGFLLYSGFIGKNIGTVYLPPPISPPTEKQIEELAEQTIRLGDGRVYYVEYPLETPAGDPCPICGAWNMCVGDFVYIGACQTCYGDIS